MDENAYQPRSGIRDRRIYAVAQELRRAGHWLLRGIETDVCSANAERVHTGVTRRAFQKAQAAGDLEMCFRDPPGEEGREVGSRSDGGKDGRVPVAETPGGRAV